MAPVNGRMVIALVLTAALVAAVPAAAPAGNAGAAKATRKKAKGKKKKRKCPARKKATARFPADGTYTSGDGALNIGVSTSAGKRTVIVRVKIPLTCTPSGVTQPRTLSISNLPLSGVGFAGKSNQDPSYGFGETTVSGTFLSPTRVHVAAQNANYKNGTEVCGGSVDITTNITKGY